MTTETHPRRNWFVDTHTARMMKAGIDHVLEVGSNLLIVGPPGIGKTATLNHIVQQDGSARLVTVAPANKGMKALLIAIAKVFGVHTGREQTHDIQEIVCDRLCYFPDNLLLIDEAQNLELDAFRTALYLHEETGLPIVFVGNPTTLKRVYSKHAAFEQISDRLYRRIVLEGVTREDAIAFGVRHNVEGMAAYEYLVRFALKSSIRQLEGMLQEARLQAGPKGSLCLDDLATALSRIRGPEIAQELLTATPKEDKDARTLEDRAG